MPASRWIDEHATDDVTSLSGTVPAVLASARGGIALDAVRGTMSRREWILASLVAGVALAFGDGCARRSAGGARSAEPPGPPSSAGGGDGTGDRHRTLRSALVASRYACTLGVPALFPRGAFRALLAQRGREGAKAMLRGAGDAVVVSVDLEEKDFDVDTPEDEARLRAVERRLRGGPVAPT